MQVCKVGLESKGLVEAPQFWVKNGTNSFIKCYHSVGLGFVEGWFQGLFRVGFGAL